MGQSARIETTGLTDKSTHSSPEHQSPCPRYLNIAHDQGYQNNEFKLYFKEIPGALFAKYSLQVFEHIL